MTQHEGKRILTYWYDHVVGTDGRFIGEIDAQGIRKESADRGCVLASRIIWSFARGNVRITILEPV